MCAHYYFHKIAVFQPVTVLSSLPPLPSMLCVCLRTKVLLVDRRLSASVYPSSGLMANTSDVDATDPDLVKYPLFQNVMPLTECELRHGEMLYIPPLFWHHITSMEVSFSVSFWWGKRRVLPRLDGTEHGRSCV